jgi:hypothetical protein
MDLLVLMSRSPMNGSALRITQICPFQVLIAERREGNGHVQ